MGLENSRNNFMESDLPFPMNMFGMKEWKTGDALEDGGKISRTLNFLKESFPEWNAGQMKAFLYAACAEIDERARI